MADKIIIQNVTKRFGEHTALDDISLRFEEGKIHGIIGRNGSGKTVLFKCICGFMKPSQGEILVNDKKVAALENQDIGIIIENPGFIDALSGFKNLKALASVKKVIGDEEIREALIDVGLDPDEKKAVRKYSLGMKHRLGIAQAIMERPSLLLLDEPMNGLDRNGVLEMRKLFLRLKEDGMTILISSHYMEDIETLCDTITEFDQGKVIRTDGMSECSCDESNS